MRQFKRGIACVLLAATCGCMQYLVQPPAPSIAGDPHKVETKSYLGSHLQQPPYVLAEACLRGEQLARVRVTRDALQGFISWITFGLATPATVHYECANRPRPRVGDGSGDATTDGTGGE
jgi:hypothetical protein